MAWPSTKTLAMLRFDRIQHLLSPDELHGKLVIQIGVGSGGAAANDHLTMNGVRRWTLFDHDSFDDVNLVKHPRLRAQLGRPKVENQREWILDRNPTAEVGAHAQDVLMSKEFPDLLNEADLVLCCADKPDVRTYVNAKCVEARKPCITASVYRQGFGGEVYAYVPGVFGCFQCMSRIADEQHWNIEDSIALTPEEEQTIYGLHLRDFKASGLSMDIQAIALLQSRVALDVLLAGTERKFGPMPGNWIIFYNRPVPNNRLSGFLKSVHIKVSPRKDCQCNGA